MNHSGSHLPPQQPAACGCFSAPGDQLAPVKELGMDSIFAQVSLLKCPACGQHWLRYHYELEAFTASGRWYLGAITAEQASRVTAENARSIFERLSWYFYGGSYFDGRSGRASGSLA